MKRPVTLVSGQWSDLGLSGLCDAAAAMSYDGIELAVRPAFFSLEKAAASRAYCEEILASLGGKNLLCLALSSHAIGKCVADSPDPRLDALAPEPLRGKPDEIRKWAVDSMMSVPTAAKNLGCTVVTTFMGSPIWPCFYAFPPTPDSMIDEGYARFVEAWRPILDEFRAAGVFLALEPHPSELAFDFYSTRRLIAELEAHEAFGLNVDPSHLLWQGVDPAEFVREFAPFVRHAHMKDVAIRPNGRRGILGSHLPFGDCRRAWNFRSVGRGDVDFEELLRALDDIAYSGPLSVEWEDNGMDRCEGAAESLAFLRGLQRSAPERPFDAHLRQPS
jgi:sugar phosphate isomerase/epimerase